MYFLFYAYRHWQHHEVWKCRILKFGFLKNETSFWSEIKNIFLVWQVLPFRIKKQTNKNVVGTTFKLKWEIVVLQNLLENLPYFCLGMKFSH